MEKIINYLKYILLIFGIFFSLLAYKHHIGDKYLYLIYCFLINLILYLSLNKKKFYLEIYFSLFLWLGFWFKYVFSLLYYEGIYDSGPFENFNKINIDKVFTYSIYIFLSIIVFFIVRPKIIKLSKFNFKKESSFEKFVIKHNNVSIIFFLLLILLISILNLKYSFYQKGFIVLDQNPILLTNFFKWMLLFGLSSISCFIIFIRLNHEKKFSYLYFGIGLFEIFNSYTSMLSRSGFFNQIFMTFSTFKDTKFLKLNYKIVLFIVLLVCSSIIASNLISNSIRLGYAKEILAQEKKTKTQNIEKKLKNNKNLLNQSGNDQNINDNYFVVSEDNQKKASPANMSYFLIINRWTGIDSLIAVVGSEKLSFKLLKNSFKEKKTLNKNTFYEANFKIHWDGGQKIFFGSERVLKGNTLPGIISFLMYSGNISFVVFFLFLLLMILCFVEKICMKISNSNYIFTSFISYMVVFRLFNFGYAPADSYLFLSSVILSCFLIYFLNNCDFGKFFNNQKYNKL